MTKDRKLAKRLGRRIRDRRTAAGWSQSELGNALGIATSAVSRYERGGAMPGVEMLARLAEALECSLDDLVA